MPRSNKPAASFEPVRQALNDAGYGTDVYSDRRMLRDIESRFIPSLTGDATDTEIDNAVTAALVCAKARSESNDGRRGHLCRVLGWRLLSMNDDPAAAKELRKQLREAVERLESHEYGPKLPALTPATGKAIASLSTINPEPVMALFAEIARDSGIAQQDIDSTFQQIEQTAAQTASTRSPSTGLRDALRIIAATMGTPMEDLDQKNLAEALSSLHPLLSWNQGPDGRTVPFRPSTIMWNLTDTHRALALLDTGEDLLLRRAMSRMGAVRHTENFPHEEHEQQSCRTAADWDALLVCQLIDPAAFAWWRASYGDLRPLASLLMEGASGSMEG